MINFKHGDLVAQLHSGILVHQVNAQGVMGSGIAKQLRQKYPSIWDDYSSVVKPNRPDAGAGYLGLVIPSQVTECLVIMNIVGQQYYGAKVPPNAPPDFRFTDYDALKSGFDWINGFMDDQDLHTVNLPLIGCGLARGRWDIVQPIIEASFSDKNVIVWKL